MLKALKVGIFKHGTVTMNVDHSCRGDLSVELVSPDKVVSHLAATRRLDKSTEGYNDWTFMSVVHWSVDYSSNLVFTYINRGESGIGTWTVIVKDTEVNQFNGTFVDWHLKLWGESIDGSKQQLLPMPSEHDDDNHADIISTTTIAGTTQAAVTPVPTRSSPPMTNPTDHPDRPVNEKPSGTEDEITKPTTTAPASATSTTSSSWLPSFFPTFGVSSKTQIWIYGAAGLILVFCAGLGVYFFLARRRRLRNNPRDEWEFDLLEEDEADGLNGGPRVAGAKKGTKRRAGELYDAFAAGSEDESEGEYADEDVDVGGEREKALYDDDEEEGSPHHVIGDESDEEDEKKEGKGDKDKLLHK
jgi:kexin